jgi:hypothetical protein
MCRYWRMTPDQIDALDDEMYAAMREYMDMEAAEQKRQNRRRR